MPPSLHLDSSLSKLQHLARQRNTPPHAPIFIKLLDLGMAGFSDSNGMISGRCGTPGYVAPEVLKAGQDEKYPNNVDMFSLGVVAYTLLCGYEPFFGRNEHELMLVNKHIQFEFHSPEWDEISESAKDFISRTICPVDIRMTPSDAKQHPWLRQATHNSDMRMLGRMRNMVLKVGKPSQALSCSSHHYLGPKNKVKETHLPAQPAPERALGAAKYTATDITTERRRSPRESKENYDTSTGDNYGTGSESAGSRSMSREFSNDNFLSQLDMCETRPDEELNQSEAEERRCAVM